jgi:hypothetical protein
MDENRGVKGRIAELFKGFKSSDSSDPNAMFEMEGGASGGASVGTNASPNSEVGEGDTIAGSDLRLDRRGKYELYELMSQDALVSSGLDIHVSHALSAKPITGEILTIESTTGKDKDFAKELRGDLQDTFNKKAVEIAKVMATYGCNYAKPHWGKKGLMSLEHDFHTLPHTFKQYVRGGEIAGYTSEYLENPKKGNYIELEKPWELTCFKTPHWQPNPNLRPLHADAQGKFSLRLPPNERLPIETQNYGTSLIATCYEPYVALYEGMLAMQAARRNSARQERLIGIDTNGLDQMAGAELIQYIQRQLKSDASLRNSTAASANYFQSFVNTVIPKKGAWDVETQEIKPNIKDIEDIMFNAKRLASSMSLDLSLLGFGDLMSGGLGDGGFLQTSIQALTKANWIRNGMASGYEEIIKSHVYFKHGKIITNSDKPYRLMFNSMNTAVELKEAASRTANADFALQMVNLMMMMNEASLPNPVKNWVLTDHLGIDEDKVNTMLDDLSATASSDEKMLASAGIGHRKGDKAYVKDLMLDLINELEENN